MFETWSSMSWSSMIPSRRMMLKLKISATAALALALNACSTIPYSDDFQQTIDLIENAKTACKKNMDNAPLAQRECFPLLSDKKLLVKVSKIANGSFFRIEANAGTDRNIIWCKPDRKEADNIMKNPALITIGKKY